MISKQNWKIVASSINSKMQPLSIITQEFSDIDLKIEFEKKYDVIILEESMGWTKFLEWFKAFVIHKQFFSTNRQRIMIINTDLITRIPNEKTDKQRIKKTSVYNFIRYVSQRVVFPVILITEQSKKYYRMQCRPAIIGNVINYSNPMFIAGEVLNNKNIDEVIYALNKFGTFYDPVMNIVVPHILKYNSSKEVINAIKLYYGMRFESRPKAVVRLIASMFKTPKQYKIMYPKYYKKMFDYTTLTPKILKNL